MNTKTKKIAMNTALISIGALAIYSFWQRKRTQVPVFYRKKLINNYNARTIPPFGIYIKEDQRNNLELLNHEIVHWQQYKEKGLLPFYFDYFSELNKYGYDNMPMEIEARKNESDYCKTNYTECVRNGSSITVNNLEFRN